MKKFLLALSTVFFAVCFSSAAHAGKKDDAWAKCIWEKTPTSAANWIEMPVPKRRSGLSEPSPQFVLKHRLEAACAKALTKEGKTRHPGFNAKKVHKALKKSKPGEILADNVDPRAYRCARFFLNDKEMKRPAGYRWGYGEDTSKAQFFLVSYTFAAKGGGAVGLPHTGGLEKCQYIADDGSFLPTVVEKAEE